jgi:hypothetical protein
MTRTFAVLTAILAASFSVPTKAEANPAWVGAVLMGAGLGGILSFRQATRHAKQLRARDRPRLAAGAASSAFLAAAGGSPSSSLRQDAPTSY